MGGPKTLGRVFDDRYTVLFGNGIDAGHVSVLAVNAYRHDGAGARSDGGFEFFRVHIEGVWLDIDKDGFGPQQGDDFGCGNPGIRDSDNFVSGVDV